MEGSLSENQPNDSAEGVQPLNVLLERPMVTSSYLPVNEFAMGATLPDYRGNEPGNAEGFGMSPSSGTVDSKKN